MRNRIMDLIEKERYRIYVELPLNQRHQYRTTDGTDYGMYSIILTVLMNVNGIQSRVYLSNSY